MSPFQSGFSDEASRYNSAIYASIPTNSYQGFAVSQTFVESPKCQNCTNLDVLGPSVYDESDAGKTLPGKMLENIWAKSRNGSLDRLDPAECIAAYGTLIQSTRRNLLVVIADEHVDRDVEEVYTSSGYRDLHTPNLLMTWSFSAQYSLGYWGRRGDTIPWICSDLPYKDGVRCSNRLTELSPQNWTISPACTLLKTVDACTAGMEMGGLHGHPYRWPVEYCLSEPAEDRCQMHFSPLIAGVVTALNFCESSALLTCLRT